MKTLRSTSVCASALVLALALLVPAAASAQQGTARVGTGRLVLVATNTYQFVRVTVGNPALVSPTPDGEPRDTPPFYLRLQGVDGDISSHTIDPGEAYTYTLDPRSVGRLVDPKTGLRHVPVHFEIVTDVVEGVPAPTPAVTIELVNVRTGAVESFHAFPGFTGGVYVAAGDVN